MFEEYVLVGFGNPLLDYNKVGISLRVKKVSGLDIHVGSPKVEATRGGRTGRHQGRI